MIGGGDDDCVDILPFQELPIVGINGQRSIKKGSRFFRMKRVHVAERAHVFGDALKVAGSFAAYSDMSGDYAVVGSWASIYCEYAAGYDQREGRGCSSDECSSGDSFGLDGVG